MRCPVCKKEFDSSTSASLPFCSPRCRQIDLGRWLGEGYALEVKRSDDEEDELPPDSPN